MDTVVITGIPEAAAGGLPIVALPSSQGVVELLRNQPGVWLAREISVHALATTILAAIKYLQPGQRFAHPWIEEFRLERAIQAYKCLIDATLKRYSDDGPQRTDRSQS